MSEINIVSELNSISGAWKSQFEHPPALPLSWRLDDMGNLRLDDILVCRGACVLLKEPSVDVDRMTIETRDGYVDIIIDWPCGGPARISEIVHHQVIEK